jgi:hypothetical protein
MCKIIYNFLPNYKFIYPNFEPQEILWVRWRNVSYNFVILAEVGFILNVSVTHNIKNFTPRNCYAISDLQAAFRKQFKGIF